MRSPFSARRIAPFVETNGVDMEGCPPVESYKSFAEFFSRPKDVRPYGESDRSERLLAVADSRLLAVPIGDDGEFRVEAKGTTYALASLMGEDKRRLNMAPEGLSCPMTTARCMSRALAGGACLVFRLSLADWHRFLFPFDGHIVASWEVPGQLHSVRRVADGARPYSMNKRCVSVLEAVGEHPDVPALMVEVGALLVGRITQELEPPHAFRAGREKGMFELGGSTVVLAVPASVAIDDDILRNSRAGKETLVRAGEPIGTILRPE